MIYVDSWNFVIEENNSGEVCTGEIEEILSKLVSTSNDEITEFVSDVMGFEDDDNLPTIYKWLESSVLVKILRDIRELLSKESLGVKYGVSLIAGFIDDASEIHWCEEVESELIDDAEALECLSPHHFENMKGDNGEYLYKEVISKCRLTDEIKNKLLEILKK